MRKILKMLLATCLCLPLFLGCTPVKKTVLYSIYPVGWLVNMIGGNTTNVESIQEDGSIVVQRATLKSNYREILQKGKVFFHIGNLEPYLSVMGKTMIESGIDEEDLSTMNAIYNFNRYSAVITNGERTYVETQYYDGEVFDSIDILTKELSFWNDPISMLSMAKNIRDWFKKAYPESAELYDENYIKLEKELIDIDSKYQAFGTSLAQKNQEISFVTMTASYGGWQKTYGFQVYPLILSRYGVLPTEEQLIEIEKRIQKDNVKYIVHETNMNQEMEDLFTRVQNDLGLIRIDLSNLSALSDTQKDEGKDYLSIMYENLAVIQTILANSIPVVK